MIDQRATFERLGALHSAEHDDMVAGFDHPLDSRFEPSQATVDERRAGCAGFPADALESGIHALGKSNRIVSLMFRKDIYGEAAADPEMRQHGAASVDAHQDQRRVAGDRREGVNGQSMGRTIGGAERYDRDSGGKARASDAKLGAGGSLARSGVGRRHA